MLVLSSFITAKIWERFIISFKSRNTTKRLDTLKSRLNMQWFIVVSKKHTLWCLIIKIMWTLWRLQTPYLSTLVPYALSFPSTTCTPISFCHRNTRLRLLSKYPLMVLFASLLNVSIHSPPDGLSCLATNYLLLFVRFYSFLSSILCYGSRAFYLTPLVEFLGKTTSRRRSTGRGQIIEASRRSRNLVISPPWKNAVPVRGSR